ncbi:MAG: hypothetical protein HY892_02920 [Deltaproteobacteria bacterium]|nr:hypothetical protein [Deltaproteobacteria bacterium]
MIHKGFKILFLAFLIPAVLLAGGCAHLSPDLKPNNVAPLFHVQTDEEKEARRVDAAGPFYSQSESPEEKEWSLRPFFWYRQDLKNRTEELEFLYPLGWYKKTPLETSLKILPFYQNRWKVEEEEEPSRDYTDLFPFFWGKSRSGEPYGGFFPLGGVFRDRFSRDEIQFALWPLYTHIREGETETTHILWPVFSLTAGGPRQGFRFWPLYGRETLEGEGAYEKTFFLWPVFHYQKRHLDSEVPETYFYIFPLYVSESSAKKQKTIYLWPFFSFYTVKEFDYFQVDFPWPFIQYASGENVSSFKLWPLITYRQEDNRIRRAFLWPIFYQDFEEDDYKIESKVLFCLLTKIHEKYFKKEKRWERVTRIWPLFRHADDGLGRVHFFFPAIMPADWDGLERNYGMLFRIFDYYEDGQGLEVTKFLWGLYYRQKEKAKNRIEVTLLFDWQETPDRLEFNVLKGLFGYRREGDLKILKLFYLPLRLEEERPSG